MKIVSDVGRAMHTVDKGGEDNDGFLAWTVSVAAALSFMAASGAAQTNAYKGEITDEHLNCV
jgi:hypothetical protein